MILDFGLWIDQSPGIPNPRDRACAGSVILSIVPRLATAKSTSIDATTARRLLLGTQGLLLDPARDADAQTVFNLIQQMGFVQIDSINTLDRAHHLTLFSRLDHYQHEMLRHLLEDSRRLFEHWTHDASGVPTHLYPHWKHRFLRHRRRIRENAWWKERMGTTPMHTIRLIRRRIEAEGPLSSRDFEHDHEKHPLTENGWWGWKPAKAALEYLWRTGELTVARRVNFQKVYDLTERVLPPDVCACETSTKSEHVNWACLSAMERLVLATPSEIAAFWHAVSLPEVRRWCTRAVKGGDLIPVQVEGADDSPPRECLAIPDWMDRAESMDEPPRRIRFLSPFDPVLRDRARMTRLFDFDYRFEAFVPATKRQYGYYVLPMLEGDRLIGRMDAAFKRERSTLEVNRIWLEDGIKPTRQRNSAIDESLERLANFIGARRVAKNQKQPQ